MAHVVTISPGYRDSMPTEYFFFDLPTEQPKKAGWYRARWAATREDVERRGGRVVRLAEVRHGVGSTSGHLQSSPAPSRPLPTDLMGAGDIVQRTPDTSTGQGTGDSESSAEPASWGMRLVT